MEGETVGGIKNKGESEIEARFDKLLEDLDTKSFERQKEFDKQIRHPFYIAIALISIFGAILIIVALSDLVKGSNNLLTKIEAVVAIFSGWMAAIIGYYFNEKHINAERVINKDQLKQIGTFSKEQIGSERKVAKKYIFENLREQKYRKLLKELNQEKDPKYRDIRKLDLSNKIGAAFNYIYNEHFDCIPVTDKNNKLEAVLTKTDLSNYLMKKFAKFKSQDLTENDVIDLVEKWNKGRIVDEELKSFFNKNIEGIRNEIEGFLKDPDFLSETDTLKDAIQTKWVKERDAIPLVDAQKKLVGIVTQWDILKYLNKLDEYQE